MVLRHLVKVKLLYDFIERVVVRRSVSLHVHDRNLALPDNLVGDACQLRSPRTVLLTEPALLDRVEYLIGRALLFLGQLFAEISCLSRLDRQD